jgi:DNA repair exonuclease SbcCD ATPase subunit
METEIRKNARDNGNPHYNKSPDEIKKMATFFIKTSCPHCQKGIGIHNEKLFKWNDTMNDGNSFDFTKLTDLKYEWDENAPKKWETQVKTRMRAAELRRLIDKQILSNELVRLKKSFGEYLTPPKSFKTVYTSAYLRDRIDELTEMLGSYPKESDRQFLETIVSIKKYPTRERISELAKVIEDLEIFFQEQEELRDRYLQYQTVEKLQNQIDDVSTELKDMEKKTNEIKTEMLAVDRLKQLQREAETMSMETVVNTLNTIAADNLAKFFDDMIRVELILYKKTLKNTKMSIELEIEYNGQKYDISEFSQGETIKINLAFILAMNRLQNSKYLFLDEVLQNLDKDILLEIYSCLHSLCSHMSIFVIQHNSIDGFFDHTIDFKK